MKSGSSGPSRPQPGNSLSHHDCSFAAQLLLILPAKERTAVFINNRLPKQLKMLEWFVFCFLFMCLKDFFALLVSQVDKITTENSRQEPSRSQPVPGLCLPGREGTWTLIVVTTSQHKECLLGENSNTNPTRQMCSFLPKHLRNVGECISLIAYFLLSCEITFLLSWGRGEESAFIKQV